MRTLQSLMNKPKRSVGLSCDASKMQVIPKSTMCLKHYQWLADRDGTIQQFGKTYKVESINGRAVTLVEVK